MEPIGILFLLNPRLSLEQAIQLAIGTFENAPHTGHHPAAEAHFHPDELPAEPQIHSLTILPDPAVRPGHIRILAGGDPALL